MPSIYVWEGDILMILDCCYALQASRDRDSRTVELLAACGVVERTPPAGDWSFTARLIEVMSQKLSAQGTMTVEEIYHALLQLNGDRTGIERGSNGDQGIDAPRPLAFIPLTISLSKALDESTMREVRKWLRIHIPPDVSATTVDEVLVQTERIQTWLKSSRSRDLETTIANDLMAKGHADTIVLQPSLFEAHTTLDSKTGNAIVDTNTALSKLMVWNEDVYQSILSDMMLNPVFCLSEAAKLRLISAKLEDQPSESSVSALAFDCLSHVEDSSTFTTGILNENVVLIENRPYGNDYKPKADILLRIKKLSRLLAEVSSPMFHVARYVGYVDRPLTKRISLVFETGLSPLDADEPFVTLEQAYQKER
ncbi:hypothetical protein F4679DRAFT_583512 [Xylaria curta]|nr:hypothetical protein F4679DRAFT_583512 [Xylaria curta]